MKQFLLVLTLLGLCHCLYALPLETDVRRFSPFAPAPFQATIEASEQQTGHCLGQSRIDKRRDALHCRSQGREFDPCFIKYYGNHQIAICPHSPWQTMAVMLTLDHKASPVKSAEIDMSQALPWAVELSDGSRCIQSVLPTAIDGLDAQSANFRCNDASVLLGQIQRCQSLWRILHLRHGKLVRSAISRAWF